MFMSSGKSLPGPEEGLGSREHSPVPAASVEDAMSQFAAHVVNRLFSVGLSLESARSIVGEGPAGDRLAAATGEVDRMIHDIRTMLFDLAANRGIDSPDRWSPPSGGHPDRTRELPGQEQSAPTADRAARLQERMTRTARALQAAAAEYAALLEQQAALARTPGRTDYPAEIKRWQAFADQAEQMARRWDQPSQPEGPPDTGPRSSLDPGWPLSVRVGRTRGAGSWRTGRSVPGDDRRDRQSEPALRLMRQVGLQPA
jgi:hypothetical protein